MNRLPTVHTAISTHDLILNLLIVLALFAAFAWSVRRGLLQAKEVLWIGTAMAFFATSLIFNAALRSNRPVYLMKGAPTLLGITALMVLPLVLAFAYGISALYRSVEEKQLAVAQFDSTTLRLLQGNIAALRRQIPLDAIIIPASADLRMRTGVAAAVKSFGGAVIELEALGKAPVAVGQAVATGGGRLSVSSVIHSVIAEKGRRLDADILKRALAAALQYAKSTGARRVALPALGAATGSLPAAEAAPATLQAVLKARKDFDEIVIVVFDKRAAPPYLAEFKKL